MSNAVKYLVSLAGAAALVGGVMTSALASRPLAELASFHNLNGNQNVTGVLHVRKNETVYGNFFVKGRQEIYKGLLIRANGLNVTGGIKSDGLSLSGTLNGTDGVFSGGLNVTNALTAGSISSTGKIAGNGMDAGAGGLTTSGGITAGSAGVTTGGKVTASGGVDAGSGTITTSGTVNASNIAAGNIVVTGLLDLSHATINGASSLLSNLTTLTIGSMTGTTSPLTLQENGKTAQIGVDAAGNVTASSLSTTGDVTVGGNLNVHGTTNFNAANLTASSLTAPNATGTTSPGALSLTGNGITLNGATSVNGALTANSGLSLGNASDLTFSTTTSSSGASAGHVNANGDKDVAGAVTVTVQAGAVQTGGYSATVTFTKPFASQPIVTVTALQDPDPNGAAAPKVWVTPQTNNGQYTGFTLHYVPNSVATVPLQYAIAYGYHVIGS
ncbi:MAG TPA: hypothetical protein VFB58_08615 [Chloroflexota bacterium]|nr:hypothetical protein [Chloroflexota bacterium]